MKESSTNFINMNSTIFDVIKKMNANRFPIIAVVNNNKKLIGILTDGDLRRIFENKIDNMSKIETFINKNPICFYDKDFPLNQKKFNILKKRKIIPLLTNDKIFKKFIFFDEYDKFKNFKIFDNPVIIMAGGFGKRLIPYTNFCPKPMLKIGDKPLIEHIIQNLNNSGFYNIHILIHYMPEVFENYFDNKKYLQNKINLHLEKKPMGTVGGLYKIREFLNKDFFVLNGDNIINANWERILHNHVNNNNTMTICSSNYSIQIPFGVVKQYKNKLVSIDEKPVYNWKTVCSAYCCSIETLKFIKEEYMDMPTLISDLINKKKDIGLEEVQSFQRIEDLVEENKQFWKNRL